LHIQCHALLAQTPDGQLRHAFEESRKRHSITLLDRQLLQSGVRRYLGSVNRFARIRWGQAVCCEFEDFFGLDDHQPFLEIDGLELPLLDGPAAGEAAE
jgi:hypothetical protein